MSKYRPVDTRLWDDRKFLSLTTDGQRLWLFLLTCPSTPIPGVILLGEGAMCDYLEWSRERFAERFAELIKKGFQTVRERRVVWLKKALEFQRPANPNALRCWANSWDDVPDGPLKIELWKALRISCKSWDSLFIKLFAKPFGQRLPEPLAQPLTEPSLEPCRDGSPTLTLTQTQTSGSQGSGNSADLLTLTHNRSATADPDPSELNEMVRAVAERHERTLAERALPTIPTEVKVQPKAIVNPNEMVRSLSDLPEVAEILTDLLKPEPTPESPQGDVCEILPSGSAHPAKIEPETSQVANQASNKVEREPSGAAKGMALRLYHLVKENNPDARVVKGVQQIREDTLRRWGLTFDIINRIDLMTWQDIELAMEFSQRDTYWRAKILGADNLRDNWDKVTADRRSKRLAKPKESQVEAIQREILYFQELERKGTKSA